MSKARFLQCVGIIGIFVAVSACEDGKGISFKKKEDAGAEVAAASLRPANVPLVEQDLEAPDVFETSDKGLWDGRPSLGGVWVAYPGVENPERVIIRNKANGKTVIGALFKRERENPGPKLQVSSDAANALGLLAGAPGDLHVVALRRTEVETPETAETVADLDSQNIASDGPLLTDTQLQEEIEAPEAIETARLEPLGTSIASEIEAPEIEKEITPPEQKKWFWNKRRAADAEPAEVPLNGLKPLEAAAAAIDKAEEEKKAAQRKIAASVITPAAETVAQIPASARKPVQPRTLAKPVAAKGKKHFIQIGIFSVEENADRTAAEMRKKGIIPTVLAQESAGKPFWRVVVGPATSAGDRAILLKKVKGLGFADAYYVTN